MATDREVLREIWEGKLPICFQLNSEEVNDIQAPEPLYLMVPRLSYFPLVVDKVRKHFTKFINSDNQDNEMWLEHNGTSLKWHYPIGVLFDLYKEDIQLPWSITVHFDKFPENELLHCKSRDNVESHFMACLKEADALKHKTQLVSNMQRKDHTQLWLGLQNDKFDQFWAVNRRLMEPGPEDGFKYVPFRLYHKDDSLVQKLIRPIKDNGERKTLQDLLQEMFPDAEKSDEVQTFKFTVQKAPELSSEPFDLVRIFFRDEFDGSELMRKWVLMNMNTDLECLLRERKN